MKAEQSHGPIPDEIRADMQAIAKALDAFLNETGERLNGFILLLFPLNKADGRISYISNSNRDDCVSALKEFIANCEGRKMQQPKGVQ